VGSRREQALAIGLIVLILVLAMLTAPDTERGALDPRASTFRSAGPGALALLLTLRELGVPADRRLTSWVEGDPPRGVLAVLAPAQPLTPREAESLLEWVGAGGTLIHAAHPGDPLLEAFGLALEPLPPGPADPPAMRPLPHPWTEGIGEAGGFGRVFADTSRAMATGEATPLLRAPDGRAAVLVAPVGRGRVMAWGDVGPLRNAGLREGGAALLFARAAADLTERGDTLWFDEYHQGYREEAGAVLATLRFLRDTGPGRMALQLGLAGLGLLVLLGARFGTPLSPPPARRRSPLEHVEALAGAYQRGGARTTARRLVIAGLARRLGRAAPAPGTEAEWLDRLETGLPGARANVRALREEWERGERADLVALAARADDLVRRARGRRPSDHPARLGTR
jgi:hypothetical protein